MPVFKTWWKGEPKTSERAGGAGGVSQTQFIGLCGVIAAEGTWAL